MSAVTPKPSIDEPARLPAKKLPPFTDIALPLVSVGSGLLLGIGVPNIIETTGFWTYAKAGVLAGSAMVVSLAVNKLANERGAVQASKGYLGATIVSLGSIVAVGAGLFGATYSGLVFRDVAELQLQQHGAAVAEHVALQTAAAAKAGRVLSAMRAVETDLQQKRACEIDGACISGRGGGYGPVARIVEEQAGHATSISQQIAAGDAGRQASIETLNGLLVSYQEKLGDSESDIWSRRASLQTIDARIKQELGDLREAMPVALLSAYAQTLQDGVSIPGRAEAEARLNAILSRHGQNLSVVIGSIEPVEVPAPAFPRRTGVSDTFAYFSHFLPVAAIAAVVELVFPLVLWAYTYWALAWDIHVRDRREGRTERRPASMDRGPSPLRHPSHRDRLNGANRRGHEPRQDKSDRHPN